MKKRSGKYALIILGILFLCMIASEAVASDLEEIIVVGAKESIGYSQPEYDNSVIEGLDSTKIYQPGGVGGFAGHSPNGTDVKHTAVYRNGIPVNDPGSGWYDFGTDLPSFQSYKTIHGPNSSLYGSSSMAGTILIEDNFDGREFFLKTGEKLNYLIGGTDWFQVSRYKGSNGSVKTDNNEEDWFENTTLKTNTEWKQWKVISVMQDYKYDYDACGSNDCTQKGRKYDTSIRGDWLTLGYSRNNVEHNTGWNAVSEKYFIDANKEVKPGLLLGAQQHREEYNGAWDQRFATYLNYTQEQFAFGARYEEDKITLRAGFDVAGVKWAISNSFRAPNLYERYGDDWVKGNPNLQPEKGEGFQISYGDFTSWYYNFSESIDYNFQDNMYVNAGSYESKGIKYQRHLLSDDGALHVMVGYTDSDRIRVAKYKTKISWYGGSPLPGWDYLISYVGQFDKGNDFDGSPIDNVSSFNFNMGYYLTPRYRIGFQIRDIFDRNFEILPGYSAGGREISLSLDLSL